MQNEQIKDVIIESYSNIAKNRNIANGCSCSSDSTKNNYADYSNVNGYKKEADLHLGCGLPTEIANIREGDTVVDLGSGAGNDVFVARSIVGERGKVIGVDMTPEMVSRAIENNNKLGFKNVEFFH